MRIHFNFNEGMFKYHIPIVCLLNDGGLWLYLAVGIPWWKYGVRPDVDWDKKEIYYSPKVLFRVIIKKKYLKKHEKTRFYDTD